jgi:hypothetical protein
MPIFSTIRGSDIGPYFQCPRLQGTPDGAAVDEDEDSRRKCCLCLGTFAPDELTEYRGQMYCEECLESAKERDRREAKAEARELQADWDIELRKDRELLKEE